MTACCETQAEVGSLAAHLYEVHHERAWPSLVAARKHFGFTTERPVLLSAAALRGLLPAEPIAERPTVRRRTPLAHDETIAPGRRRGALKTAALRVGVSVEEWQAKREQGLKWCHGCRAWQPLTEFPRDRTRGDGRASACAAWRNRDHRAHYTGRRQKPTPRVPREECQLCARLGERAPCKRHGGSGYSTSWSARRERRVRGIYGSAALAPPTVGR